MNIKTFLIWNRYYHGLFRLDFWIFKHIYTLDFSYIIMPPESTMSSFLRFSLCAVNCFQMYAINFAFLDEYFQLGRS